MIFSICTQPFHKTFQCFSPMQAGKFFNSRQKIRRISFGTGFFPPILFSEDSYFFVLRARLLIISPLSCCCSGKIAALSGRGGADPLLGSGLHGRMRPLSPLPSHTKFVPSSLDAPLRSRCPLFPCVTLPLVPWPIAAVGQEVFCPFANG